MQKALLRKCFVNLKNTAELRRDHNAEDIGFGLFHAVYANYNGS
jgi:hypothetical protein